uniref:Mucin n=1 Tax=Rhipicephalus appendiculatus TaxID=34631 RepID=A0A131YBK7_RHIAP
MALNRLKACGGLQPVPEESAANGTTAAANPDATAAAAALPVNLLEHCVKNADGTNPNNAGVTTGRSLRRWCSEDAATERPPPDNVPEKEFRIWFPRAEVSHEDSTDRASSDWRTFREYRYTECSRAGRLEKTLSVDEVYKNKDSPGTLATTVRQPTSAFHCVSCSSKDEDKGGSLGEEGDGRCRMLSSTKSELFREHRGQVLSRLIDDDFSTWERSPQPLETWKPKFSQDPGTVETGRWEKEARTSSVCQTNTEKVAFEGDDFAKKRRSSDVPSSDVGGLSSTPASRSLSDGDVKSGSHLSVSAGVRDASLVSVDDEFDDSKCTYVKVDSVDSEVEDENGAEDRETVIGAPSPDELGYIAEEPEEEADETTEISEVQKSFSTTTSVAAKTESSSVLSSATECRHQESLSSKLDVIESSMTDQKGDGLRFNGNTLDAAARLTADLDALVDGKSLKCHSEDSIDNENVRRISHGQEEQKDRADAAPRLDDLSDAETNESDTKSMESVISVKGGAVILPNTNGQSSEVVLADTIARSANGNGNNLGTVEMFGTSDRLNQELILNETVNITKSTDVAKSQENPRKTSKHASVLDSESTSSTGVFHHETCRAENKSDQFSVHAGDLQGAKHAHKDLTESLDSIVRKNERVFGEASLSRREELRNFEDSHELTKDAAAHILHVSESIEEALNNTSKTVVRSVTSKCTLNNEQEASVQIVKEHTSTVDECNRNESGPSASELPERSSIEAPGLKQHEFSQLLKAGTLTEESAFESATRLTSVDEVSEKTQESVTSITDDSLLSRDVASTNKASVEKDGDQRENPDASRGLKNGVEKILEIGDVLKQDTYRSTEMRFLANTEVEAHNILMCFTDDEEPWKQTSKTVSSVPNDSPSRKSVLDDDVTADVKNRDEHLGEKGIREFREHVIERFDNLALKNSRGFQAESVSVLDHSQVPNASPNKIQDSGGIVEKGSVAGNDENIPTILADEHHLFKEPAISSVEGQEGTGVMSTVTSSVHEESSLSSSIKVSMLKDVIALNRTDDETSVDDVSLQDDNDQGFESLPCDQTLDSEDLNDEQVRDESDDPKNIPPADNHSNKSADKLTELLDELVGPEKASPIRLKHETAVQTSSTEATDQKNEAFPEPELRSRISKDDVDNEGTSVESSVNGSALDEKLHPVSATSSEIEEHEETKLQSTEKNSGEGDSAVTGKHNITETAERNGDSEDIYVEGIEENTTKTSDPHSIDTSTSQQNLREEEEEPGAHDEISEHSGNRTTGDEKIGQVIDDTSVNGSQKIAGPTESSEGNEIFEELVTEKHVSWSGSDEIIELKEEHFMKESIAISSPHESSLRHETSEGLPSDESVNHSTSDSEIVKLDAGLSQTKLPNIAVPDKESVREETSEESGRGRSTHPSSSDVEVTEAKTLVEEISELVDSGASVPNEVSEGSEGGPPLSLSTITDITVIEADIPVSEISERIVPNDMSMRGELIEVCADEEPPSQSTGNKDVTRVGEEALTELMSNDLRTLSKDPDAAASEKPVAQIADDERATNFEADFSVSEFPEMAVSNELRVQSKTLVVLASEELANQRSTNVDVTDVKAEMSGGEVPEIVVITEASEVSETSEASASEATANESTNEQITKVEPHSAISELSEIAFSSESSAQSKAPHVPASEEYGNHDNITIEVPKVGEDVSIGEVAVTAASTESIGTKETAEEPASNAPVDHSTNEKITGAEQDTSVCELPDEAFSGKMSAQSKASDLLASDEPGNHDKVNIDATKENAEMSAGDVPDIAASAGPFERNGKPEQPASETPVDESSNDEITRAQQDASAFEWPGRPFSSKLSVQVKTPDALASEEPINGSADKHVVTEENAKTLVSQLPEILVSYEPNVKNTYDEFVNGETSCPGASGTEVTKETSFGEVPGTVVSTAASALCETPKESASESPVNQNNKQEEPNMTESGASVGESPATAAFNEASLQSKSSGQSSSEETRDHTDDDNWNTNAEIDISVTELPEIVASNETTTRSKSPEESASGEATHHSITDDVVEMKEDTTASKFSVVAIIGDASVQNISGKGECEEPAKESSGDNDVIKAKAETSNELLDIGMCNEECVKDNTSEESTSGGKPVNQNTSIEQLAKVDAKTLESEFTNIAVCNEVIIQSRITENLTGGEVVRQNVGDDNTEVEEQISSNVLRDVAVPDKDNVQSKTSKEPEIAAVENEDPNGVAIIEAKSEAVDSGSSDILPPNEDLTLNAAAEESASEEILRGTKGYVEIATVKENMPISKVPEINMPSEPIVRSKSPPELKSDGDVKDSIIFKDTTDVKAGRSVKETPVFATPNEASVEIGVAEELTSKENSPRMSIDNEHVETKSEISASVLPEIAEPHHQNVQTSEELASEEPVTGNGNESYATGVTPGTSADKFPERGETTKGPGFDDPNNSLSEVAETCLESETKEDTNHSIIVDGVAAQEQVGAALECTSLKSNTAKRFANADSCDELDEDNETASTGAESVESDTIEQVRSDDATQDDSIEEVDKSFKDTTRGSLEDITRERVQINDSRDSHVLNNQEQNVGEDAHETSAEEESLYHLADDTKKPSRHTSTSEGSVLETVPAEFRETTEDQHTTELANGSEAVSNSLLGEENGGTSEAPSKGGYARTPEPEKSSCEGTEGRVAAPEQFATEELANVSDEFEVPTRLATTRSELEKGDALDPEISASQNIVATMPSTAEAYNLTMAGSSVNYHFAQETQDDRSSLLAYAEEVVSTVLSMCITYLEENDQEWRTVELAGTNRRELNADMESTTEEKGIKTTSGDDGEEYKISLPHLDFANKRSSTSGDPFEPIVSRQSVFEEAEPLTGHQYVNTNRDPNEAVIIAPVRAEEARSPDEVLNSPLIGEKKDEVGGGGGDDVTTGGTGKTDETATSSKTAESVETDVPLNSAEDAGLSQVTEEHHDGDASDNSASISEALTEDAGSSETHSSTSGANRNQLPDQAVVQSDQSEEVRREEEKPVVARVLDAASSDSPAEMSETRRYFVERENKDDSEEPEHSIAMTAPLTNQESQLHENSFTESAARVSGKCPERSASAIEARRGDESKEKEEAEHETAANSFSESSVTTGSVKTEDSGKSLSEYSTRASKQESDTAPANEVNKGNNGSSSACEADVENVPNNELNETRSLDAQHTVADSNNNTQEGREETASQVEVFQESSRPSDIPQNAEDGNQDWDIREEAKKTSVPDSHDASSQDVFTEVAVNNEDNKTNEFCTDTYYDGSARQNDRYVFKHESSTVVDNDMESLGALSTVYESSLEYVRSCTDEHISASEFTATLSGDFNTAGEAMNSKIVSLKHSTTVGGVFETDEHSDEEKAEQNSKESVQLLSNAGAENESTRDVEKAMKDPAVLPGFVPEETAEAIGKPVDTNDSLPCEIQTNAQEAKETNISEAFNDGTTTREASNENVAVMKDMGVPLQVREEVGEKQDIPQSNSCRYVTEDTSDEKKPRGLKARSLDEEYTKSHEKEQRGLKARSLDEENIKRRDTSVLDDSANDVVPEVHERKIENAYESLQENRQALEQDEVATMDFSDEDERSLEDMRAHEHVVSVDVHEIPTLHESDDVGNAETAKESEREKTILNGSSSVVTTTDVADKEDNNATEKTNRTQQDVEVPVQKVEVGTEETTAMTTQDHVENSDAEGLSEKPQRTIGAIKTAVMVHDETKLEALECSEDLLQSVATEADFPSDIYEHADDDTDAGIGETNGEQPAEGLPLASDYVQSTHGDQRVPTEEHEGLDQVDASNQAKQRDEDAEVPHNRSSCDAVEDAIVPEHIQSPSNKSSTESESVSEKQDVVSNGGLKCAVEDFTRLISPDGDDIQASKKKGDEKGRIHDAAVIAEPSDDKVDSEVAEGERGDKNRERNAAGAKEDRKADNGDQEDSLKTDSSESFDLSAAGAEDNDSGSRNVKENTTHQVTEAVEQSERTEGGATGDQVRSTRIFQKTVKRTESTRTVRRTRSFLPYTKWIRGETRQRARQETRDEDDATEPVEETLVAPQQAFPAMSIPRRGLCPMPESSPGNVCSVAVQAFPSVVDQGVQVEFDEPDCITRLVELQIAMNEQEEVRRQDMKAACELVEKLEAMQLSESLMRTQLRAMDAERREQSAREARLRDELTAWQETVQQQQLLLQQLKEDLDDTEDTLAAQRQEANRLREQMLVLQESCDSGLLMVDVLGRADKEVQTPDGGQQSLPSSSPYKGIRLDNPSPVYLDQLSQHRRLSALVSSQLEATANRIAQLRREAATNRPRGSTIDDYVQDLAVRTPDDLTRRPDASPSESASGT